MGGWQQTRVSGGTRHTPGGGSEAEPTARVDRMVVPRVARRAEELRSCRVRRVRRVLRSCHVCGVVCVWHGAYPSRIK